jgi:hypothetical protein
VARSWFRAVLCASPAHLVHVALAHLQCGCYAPVSVRLLCHGHRPIPVGGGYWPWHSRWCIGLVVVLSILSDPFHAGISPFSMPAFQVINTDCTARSLWWFLPRPIQLPPLLSVLAHQVAGPMPPASPRSAMSLARSVRINLSLSPCQGG